MLRSSRFWWRRCGYANSGVFRCCPACISSCRPHGVLPETLTKCPCSGPAQDVFAPFAGHPRYSELMENIQRVTDFFNRKASLV